MEFSSQQLEYPVTICVNLQLQNSPHLCCWGTGGGARNTICHLTAFDFVGPFSAIRTWTILTILSEWTHSCLNNKTKCISWPCNPIAGCAMHGWPQFWAQLQRKCDHKSLRIAEKMSSGPECIHFDNCEHPVRQTCVRAPCDIE